MKYAVIKFATVFPVNYPNMNTETVIIYTVVV